MTSKRLIHGLAFLATAFALSARADVLPRPEEPFHGKIGRTVKESVKDFPKEVRAPKGAPNVLLIMTDDVGNYYAFCPRRSLCDCRSGSCGYKRCTRLYNLCRHTSSPDW